MATDHGPSIKDDKQYEGLRKKGMSKSRAAAIANTPRLQEGGKELLERWQQSEQQVEGRRAVAATAERRPRVARVARSQVREEHSWLIRSPLAVMRRLAPTAA